MPIEFHHIENIAKMAACKEFSANLLDKIAKLDEWRDVNLVAGKDKKRYEKHYYFA